MDTADTAELLVISPFTPAEGVLTLRREGIVKTERFSMKELSLTLKIPLEERYLPNIYAQIDLVGIREWCGRFRSFLHHGNFDFRLGDKSQTRLFEML